MKKGMNKGSAKRVVIILSLCLALLIALGAFSFAWIRNYVDVDNLEVTTGKMLYNFKLYRVNGDKVTFLASCGKDAIAKGIKAGDLVKLVCSACGGSGGGKPDSAMGGGKDPLKVDNALSQVDDFVASKVN